MSKMDQKELYKQLSKIGFTDNEAKIYLVLLRIGPSLAGAVAKASGVGRSSAYNALDSLV